MVKNNTAHILKLENGFLQPHEEREMKITKADIDKWKDKISLNSTESTVDESINAASTGILNKATVDDYMDRSGKDILNSIEADKESLSDADLNLMEDYEKKSKNRVKVLNKIKEVR